MVWPRVETPAKGLKKAHTFEQGYGAMQNLIRLFGVAPCPETKATDPTGIKAESYWKAAMAMLCDPARPPKYVTFSTRGWTPPLTPQEIAAGKKAEEMVFETWHGLAQFDGKVDPGAGVTESPAATQPDHMAPPPSTNLKLPTSSMAVVVGCDGR